MMIMTTMTESVSSGYRLTTEEQLAFERRGYIKLSGVLDPAQLRPYGEEITNEVIRLNTQQLPLEERDLYGRAFLQVSNIWRQSPAVERFVRSKDLARLAAELLGVGSVRLYHDQALYKEPGGGITPWHADQYYWPLRSDRSVTVWIPLQDTPAEAGPLAFAAGSHRYNYARDLEISAESEERISHLVDQQFEEDASPYALGDVSYHLGWTFHHAGENTAAYPRRVMTIIYIDADMIIAEPTNDHQAKDLAHWAPSRRPGDRLDTELNPILFP